MKKIVVLIGSYGSGKSELAINLALEAARSGRTELIDADMINTYFRLSERKALIEAAGIRLVSPTFVFSNVEALALPAEVNSAFHMDWDSVIFDAGGDPGGATAMGRFKTEFDKLGDGQLEVLNVVNLRRPLSESADKIIALMEELSRNSRLKVTGFVNNTNLGKMSGPDELRDGYMVLREVSDRTGIPVRYTSGAQPLLDVFLAEGYDPAYIGTPMALKTYLHRDGDSFARYGV